MKKLLLLCVSILCSLSSAWADETKIINEEGGATKPAGFQYATESVIATFGASTDGAWKCVAEEKELYISSGETKNTITSITGNSNPKTNGSNPSATSLPDNGAFAKFEVTKNGTLDVMIIINNGRTFFCVEKDGEGNLTPVNVKYYPTNGDGGIGSEADNISILETGSALDTKYYGAVTFLVKANCTYYLWVNGSKMGYYGWNFSTTRRTSNVVNNEKSGEVTVLGTTSINSAKTLATYEDFVISGTNMDTGSTNIYVDGSNYISLKLAKAKHVISPVDGITINSVTAYVVSNSTSKTSTISTYGGEPVETGNKNQASTPTSLVLAKNDDGLYEFTIGGNNSQANVVLKVNYDVKKRLIAEVSSAGYATLFFNEDVIIPEGVTAYTVGEVASSAQLNEIKNKIKANTGVILKADAGTYTFVTTTGAEDMTSALTGAVVDTPVTANSVYTLGADSEGVVGLRQYTGTSVRAYSAYYVPSAPSKSFIKLNIGGTPTGISQIENGELKIGNGAAYNLAGQRVNANAKGIVIINGKKYINK